MRAIEISNAASKPSKKFKRMPLNEKLLQHLPGCEDCKAVVAHLGRESELDLFLYRSRN